MFEGSQTYFSAAEKQGNTGHTLVPTGSLGIQDSVCWRNKTGTPPDGMIKHKMSYFSPYFITAILFCSCHFLMKNISGTAFVFEGKDFFLPNLTTFCRLTFPHARQWCLLHVRVNSQVQIIHMVVRGSGIHIGALDPKGTPSSQSLSSTWILKENTGFNSHCLYIHYIIDLFVFATVTAPLAWVTLLWLRLLKMCCMNVLLEKQTKGNQKPKRQDVRWGDLLVDVWLVLLHHTTLHSHTHAPPYTADLTGYTCHG